jgi:hypothetical protein
MRVLICIDDTDNLESIGTGEVLENLCAALYENGLGRGGFVTRHQLYLHEDIPYTSHNSAMCCEAEIEGLEKALHFCRAYMDASCAEGSDPGLCVVDLEKLESHEKLILFGVSAKNTVLKKKDAINTAELHQGAVYLSEHGGTGDGVIGALAGCGLRLSGSDGKVKGKLHPPETGAVMTVDELCLHCLLRDATDVNHQPVDPTDSVLFSVPTKAVFWQNKPTVYLTKDESGRAKWRVFGIQELKGLVD